MNEDLIQEAGVQEDQLSRYCRRCHRHLKDPASMKRGFGPVCFQKIRQEDT
ncbi:MAG: DUF6011 domain-containing protein [Methanothrix sp.]